jgi:hypothetical protein
MDTPTPDRQKSQKQRHPAEVNREPSTAHDNAPGEGPTKQRTPTPGAAEGERDPGDQSR